MLLLPIPASATFYTPPYTFTPNTVAQSAQVNANFTAAASTINGLLDHTNISNAAGILPTQLNLTLPYLDLMSTAGVLGFGVGQSGDTYPRVGLFSDASIQWGPGGTSGTTDLPDIGIRRTTNNTIQLYVPNNDGETSPVPVFDFTNAVLLSNPPLPIPGGRLYLTTGAPYTDTGTSTVLYYGPATSNVITLSNGTNEVPQTFVQISVSIGSLSSGVYDVYINSASSTTVALTLTAWGGMNTPPTRSTDGFGRPCKSATPNDLLVGAIYVNGSNQTVDNTSERWVSNLYNTIPRSLWCTDPTTTWATSSTAPVPANSSTTDGIGRVSFVSVLPNPGFHVTCFGDTGNSSGGGPAGYLGIGANSTSVYVAAGGVQSTSGDAGVSVSYAGTGLVGFNYLQRLNSSVAGGATSFNGTLTGLTIVNGLSSSVNN
jgi:hypothetical protein